jgi:signal transduction histidine kinase
LTDFDLPAMVSAPWTSSGDCGAANLVLRADIAADVPRHLHGDPTRLTQVLINLLGNAVKFTERGAVTLTVGLAPADADTLRVRFAVTDTGPGVPAAMHDAIFQPFAQTSAGRLSPHKGTGLGLAICRRLADRMGGDIALESAEGHGSTFTFSVPLSLGTTPLAAAPLPAALVAPLRVWCRDTLMSWPSSG